MNMAQQIQKLFLAGIVIMLSILSISFVAKAAQAQEPTQIVTVKSVVSRGDLVNESNLKLIDSMYNNTSSKFITKIEDAAGLEALRNLRPGNPIQFAYLRVRPMVREDVEVKAIFNKPGLSLESTVMALQDGNKGDIIKVRNLKSNKIVKATVIDDDTVSVD